MAEFDISTVYRNYFSGSSVFYGVARVHAAVSDYQIDVDPDFQRDRVWTYEQKRKFIGHLLEGGFVPPAVLNSGPGGDWEYAQLVDGKQRVCACIEWEKGGFAAELWDGTEVAYADLSKASRTLCVTAVGITFAIVRLTRAESLELYIRLNRGGTPHSEAEIARVRELLNNEVKRSQ